MNALIYAHSGGGKTVNTTRVLGERNLLISTDNSHVVLRNFERPNLTIETAATPKEFIDKCEAAMQSHGYDNIIADNITDWIDARVTEMILDPKHQKTDRRQLYQQAYLEIKQLTRMSAFCGGNVIFTAWAEYLEYVDPQTGKPGKKMIPKLPAKIFDNVCGLMNVIGRVSYYNDKDGNRVYGFFLEDNDVQFGKDQLFCRKACKPEYLFKEQEA